MTTSDLMTAADLRLMQGLAQEVGATRPDLVNSEATFGELAWNWGRGHTAHRTTWPRRLWFSGGDPVAWGWVFLPHRAARSDGSVREVTGATLVHQVHPGHAGLIDEVIGWYDTTAAGLERIVSPSASDAFALTRWAAHGYRPDLAALADDGSWHLYNERHLTGIAEPLLPPGFRFRTAEEAGPDAAFRAHLAAWAPSTYTTEKHDDVRRTDSYRGDLHVLVEAPDGTMAASAIMWFDAVNRTVEFEPVGTHPDHRRRGLARALLLHGMHRARAAGAVHATVACLGAPGHPGARALYLGVGFRELSRDAPLRKPATTR